MLISTQTGGGQIVSPKDETRFYDDVACLTADWAAHDDGARPFVWTGDGQWTDAKAAAYAQVDDKRTAMGSGITAFATASAAQAVDRAGRALTVADLQQLTGGSR